MIYKYIIDAITPSMNKYLGNSRHYKIYGEDKEYFEWLILEAVGTNKPKNPLTDSLVTITYFFPDARKRDPSNYCGKFETDGLVKAGVIKDDSFKNIKLILNGQIDRENPRTEIIVEGGCIGEES